MLHLLKNIFGNGTNTDYRELIKNGAAIIDVRTKVEFQSGHIPGSLNIPLDMLQNQVNKLNKEKPVITCCASGMRSSTAKGILKTFGFKEVYNGGGWAGLQNKLNRLD